MTVDPSYALEAALEQRYAADAERRSAAQKAARDAREAAGVPPPTSLEDAIARNMDPEPPKDAA